MKLIIDFETANTVGVDLLRVGADVYARHPATEILCLCVMDEFGQPLHTWRPGDPTNWLNAFALDSTIVFEAHNAAFEQLIWQHIMVKRYGLPAVPVRRWSCSMARAYAHGMPGGLDPLAKALHLAEQKDMEGSALTISLSRPITKKVWGEMMPADWAGTKKAWAEAYDPTPDRRPETLARVERYCMQDCRVEWSAGEALPELSEYERRVWEIDQVINQRGVKIDRPFVEATIRILGDAKRATLARFQELTGLNGPKQVEKLKVWLASQGVELPDLAAATVDKALGGKLEEDDEGFLLSDGQLPHRVHEVLKLRRLLGASAIDKYPRMLDCSADGRVRYTTQYHGAGTGRWAGRLFQPQNFPRSSIPDLADPTRNIDPGVAVAAFMTGDYRFVEDLFGTAIKAAGLVLRHALIAEPDREYHSADFAGIEMRIDLALAGQADKCELLRLNDTGEKPVDVYLDMAEDIYGIPKGQWTPPDKEALKRIKEERLTERQVGKAAVLGCGFQMGGDTFYARYGASLPDMNFAANVVDAYRKSWAPKIPELWKDLEACALRAAQHRGQTVYAACGVSYVYRTDSEWLNARLPDGQVMWYREPTLTTGRFGNPAWCFKTWKDGQWKTVDAYGGLLTENVCQKLARGLLCEAIVRLEQNGFPIVLTVHDEILAETPKGRDHKAFEQIMAERPRWAEKLPAPVPIAVEGWSGPRYRK